MDKETKRVKEGGGNRRGQENRQGRRTENIYVSLRVPWKPISASRQREKRERELFVSLRFQPTRGQAGGRWGWAGRGEARIREDCAIPVGTIGNGILPVGPKSLDCFGFSEISERLGFQGLMTR